MYAETHTRNTHLLLCDRRRVRRRGLCGGLRLSLGRGLHWGTVLSSLSQGGEQPGPAEQPGLHAHTHTGGGGKRFSHFYTYNNGVLSAC